MSQFPQLDIPWVPMRLTEWNAMGHWGQSALIKAWAPIIQSIATRQFGTQTILVPVNLSFNIYIKSGQRWDYVRKRYKSHSKAGDAQNRVTAIDKVIVDSLTQPRGRKKRGAGILVDDSPKYLTIMEPVVHLNAPGDLTVVSFEARE